MKLLRRTLIATAALVALGAQAAAIVGQPAPDFTLKDTSGKTVRLSDFKGKHVVLEWTNPGCPFVKKHYDSGNMPTTQKHATGQGVVWLSINSTEKASSDYLEPAQLMAWKAERKSAPTAVLMDEEGTVGKRYGAPVHRQPAGPAGVRRRHRQHPLGPPGRHRESHQLCESGAGRGTGGQADLGRHDATVWLQHQVQVAGLTDPLLTAEPSQRTHR